MMRHIGAILLLVIAAIISISVSALHLENVPTIFVEFIATFFIFVAITLSVAGKSRAHTATKITAIICSLLLITSSIIAMIAKENMQIISGVTGLSLLLLAIASFFFNNTNSPSDQPELQSTEPRPKPQFTEPRPKSQFTESQPELKLRQHKPQTQSVSTLSLQNSHHTQHTNETRPVVERILTVV